MMRLRGVTVMIIGFAAALIVALIVVILVVVGVVTHREPHHGDPSPSASEPVSEDAAAQSPTAADESPLPVATDARTSASGNVEIPLNKPAQIVAKGGDTAVFSLTVSKVSVKDSCPGEFATSPQHGHFVVVEITAEMPSGAQKLIGADSPDEALMPIGPAMWSITDTAGKHHQDLETDAAWSCYSDEQRAPYTVVPGEKATGLIVLDAPAAHGELVFEPVGEQGWQWKF